MQAPGLQQRLRLTGRKVSRGAVGTQLPLTAGRKELQAAPLVRLRVRTNSGVKVPVGQSTGCP